MVKQLIRLVESRKSDSFDDQKTAVQIAGSESLSENHQQFTEYLLSQVKRILHGDQAGNWYDDPATIFGGDASLQALFLASQMMFQPVACLATDSIGDPVYIRDERINGKWRVTKADPFDESKMPARGILVSKSTPTVGKMQTFGPILNIFSGLTYGKNYHVNLPNISTEIPSPGILGYSLCQVLGYAAASDILVLHGNFTLTKHI